MTQRQFDKAIQQMLARFKADIEKRLQRIRKMESGEFEVRRVKVRGYKVRAYAVSTHYRLIPVKRSQAPARPHLRVVA